VQSESTFAARGGWWVVVQSILMLGVVAAGVAFADTGISQAVFLVGASLLVLSGAVGVLGVAYLGRARTAFPQPLPECRLVQRGIYGWIRHPLYTSVMLGSLGWALVWGSFPALVMAAVLPPFFDAKAKREEKWLEQRYPEYTAYARRVRRFIPGVY
jgi:protein-S-isoprenylcysteine O-methyltransferase Ste14